MKVDSRFLLPAFERAIQIGSASSACVSMDGSYFRVYQIYQYKWSAAKKHYTAANTVAASKETKFVKPSSSN